MSPAPPGEIRQGLNDYTIVVRRRSGDERRLLRLRRPCPPWNDSLVHHYEFALFALGVDRLDVPAVFTGQDARDAMAGHVLASASFTARTR